MYVKHRYILLNALKGDKLVQENYECVLSRKQKKSDDAMVPVHTVGV